MSKQKVSLITLLAAFLFCMAAMCISFGIAHAEETVESDSVFTTVGNAALDDEGDYLAYSVGKGDSVTLRKNMALKWYAFDGAASIGGSYGAEYFSLGLSLPASGYDSFAVTIESEQMSMSKEGKTTNEVVFTPAANGNVSVSVNGEGAGVTVSASDIQITLAEPADAVGYGDFTVLVNGREAGTFTNIGKYYAKYASSSATTPMTPLAFSAEADSAVTFEIRSLNGQSFALSEGEITDDAAPVLVINSEIKQLLLGTEFDFDTVSIDVCGSSVTTDRYFRADGSGEGTPSIGSDGSLEGYTELESDQRFFEEDFGGSRGGSVSIAYELSDTNGNSAFYFIEWYAAADALSGGHLQVVDPETVVATPSIDFGGEEDSYQAAVTAASRNAEGGSIQVGEGAYFYLPSLRPYVYDETCGYTDMEFTVYYRTAVADTATASGSYDSLRIELEAEGRYEMRIVPTNSAGNAMVGEFEGGKQADITTDNVWDATNLVSFSFTVSYTGPSIEQPEEAEVGYVDVTYSFEDFEIVALEGYQTQYKLYFLELNDSASPSTVADVVAAEGENNANSLGTWREIAVFDEDKEEDEGDNPYEWDPESDLSFVPQQRGFYKVTVEVASGNLPTTTSGQIVNVTSDADVIERPGVSYWLEDNVLSVVFLGIGVLCLIGIVIVALIKPKDKAQEAAEKALKAELKAKREDRK